MTIERATDFATRLGVTQSYITKLKQAGRLVLADDGKSIDVEKSLDLIAATADPNDNPLMAVMSTSVVDNALVMLSANA